MIGSNPSKITLKNSTSIKCSIFVYLVLFALLHSLFGITCSIYMNNDNGNDESVHEVLPKFHRFLCYAVVLVQFIVVQTCESREQVRKCSAVTSKLP